MKRREDLFGAAPDQLRKVGDCSSAVNEEEDSAVITG